MYQIYKPHFSKQNLLSDIGRFYEQKLNLWKYDEFLVLLDNFSQQDEVMIMCDFLSRDIKPTDNTDEVCFYSALISTICEDCCKLYDDKKFEQLSDIIDAIHGLPEALLYKDVWREKPFWKSYIDPYRRKWDKNYLKFELKQIFNKKFI